MRQATELVLFLVVFLSISSTLEASQCNREMPVAAAHFRGAQALFMQPTEKSESCLSYVKQFVEAVTARRDAATCGNSMVRQRVLLALDREIELFNEIIAAHGCGL